jgi:hypothetical protein
MLVYGKSMYAIEKYSCPVGSWKFLVGSPMASEINV